jgi:hypothetical protein
MKLLRFTLLFLALGLFYPVWPQIRSKVTRPRAASARRRPPVAVSKPPRLRNDAPESQAAQFAEILGSGSVVVNVASNANTSVWLGLAQHGVTLIEFPADDPIYSVHPGDENFATVERRPCFGDSVTALAEEKTFRADKIVQECRARRAAEALVIRPGPQFTSPRKGEKPVGTVLTVQRVSGVVVSFIFVPVASIAQNANHVVLSYQVQEVVAAREKSGLATRLVSDGDMANFFVAQKRRPPAVTPASETALLVADAPPPTPAASSSAEASQLVTVIPGASAPTPPTATPAPARGDGNHGKEMPANDGVFQLTKEDEVEQLTIAELRRVSVGTPALTWGKPLHGLQLAIAARATHLTEVLVDVVAVRNTLTVPVRLARDQPELFIENRPTEKGAAIVTEPMKLLHTATTALDNEVLLPGQIYYYAIAYDLPVLGAKQALRVAFAHTNAADEPVTLDLSLSR